MSCLPRSPFGFLHIGFLSRMSEVRTLSGAPISPSSLGPYLSSRIVDDLLQQRIQLDSLFCLQVENPLRVLIAQRDVLFEGRGDRTVDQVALIARQRKLAQVGVIIPAVSIDCFWVEKRDLIVQ